MEQNLSSLRNSLAEAPSNFKFYLVGGWVRDKLLGIDSKDFDIEVFGATVAELRIFLEQAFGIENVKLAGNDFPVFHVDNEVQFSLPRKERKVGLGYNEFEVTVDPNMSILDAAMRRDLTINAMYYDIFSEEIIDLFNGAQHLREKYLIPVSEHFCEDPVRILRVAYFASRFGFNNFGPSLWQYANQLRPELPHIYSEKIFEIFMKIAKTARVPSYGFNFLKKAGWLDYFGPLVELENVLQNPKWHPEGNVWIHTMQVLDDLCKFCPINYYSESLFFGALLHDLGKIWATKIHPNGKINAHGHAEVGAERIGEVLYKISPNFPTQLYKEIYEYVYFHMHPAEKATHKGVRKLLFNLKYIAPKSLLWLSVSDQLSRRNSETGKLPDDYHASSENVYNWFDLLATVSPQNKPLRRIVTGEDLITLGLTPGKEFGKILKHFENLQIDGVLTEENKENFLALYFAPPLN